MNDFPRKPIQSSDSITDMSKACEVIMSNWFIVKDENLKEKHLVSSQQWEQWVEFRKEMDSSIEQALSTDSIKDIYNVLIRLQSRILSAHRVNLMQRELDEKRREIESLESEKKKMSGLRSLWSRLKK